MAPEREMTDVSNMQQKGRQEAGEGANGKYSGATLHAHMCGIKPEISMIHGGVAYSVLGIKTCEGGQKRTSSGLAGKFDIGVADPRPFCCRPSE